MALLAVSESETVVECEGRVLSDVHVALRSRGFHVHINHEEFTETRFSFKQPWSFMCGRGDSVSVSRQCGTATTSTTTSSMDGPFAKTGADQTCETDEDGDLIVKRRRTENRSPDLAITIAHAMATDLSLVGQQVWLGALLLCDFLLHYGSLLKGKVVVDLGAGAGLTSIVAAFHASTIFCTDKGDSVLQLAVHNVKRNSHIHQNEDIRVCELDWTAESPLTVNIDDSDPADSFHLSRDDAKTLCACSVILAAEVVYDEELTDAFFRTLFYLLMERPAKSVYVTVEKRQVFTIVDRDVVSPAYEHFRENLQDLCSIDQGPVRFLCSQVDLSFPQYFYYQRTKELELWKIEAVFVQPLLSNTS